MTAAGSGRRRTTISSRTYGPTAQISRRASSTYVFFMLMPYDSHRNDTQHHTATTAIHITANQSRVPPRKGIGNTPYVFAAHGGTAGAVRMANVAPSPPPSSAPPSKADASSKRRRKHKSDSSPDSQSDTGSSSGSGWSSSSSSSSHKREPEPIPLNDGEEVPDLRPHEDANEQQLERWNAHRAFERFLKREAARERAMRRVSQSASKPTSSRSNGKEVGRGPPTRRRRLHDDDAPSSPVRPLPRAHRYGYGEGYGAAGRGRSALASEGEDPSGADRDPDALPPSSPSTLPAILSSDCDVWTDTDGDPGCSSGSGRESGVPFPLGRDRADDAEEDWGAADEEAAAENRRYMIELPLQTPFPANPVLRRRVRRASEKIERQVSRGLGEMSDEDDEDGREGETRAKVNVKRDPGADERDSKERAKAEGKENARDVAAAADRYPPPVKAIPVPIPHLHSQPRTGRKTPTITSAVAPPTPESVSPRREDGEGGGGDEDDGDDSDGTGSTGSVEVDGFSISSLSSAAPWLAMRGPEDGSGDDGGGWESEDEI
ncbi:hypothetical protein FKP32DRAFT_466300 [Trametes sanguinea]|nr:hypothetical protein FKP32DRAFT_466300 [Trametes sanguinea]